VGNHVEHPAQSTQPDPVDQQVQLPERRLVLGQEVVQYAPELLGVIDNTGATDGHKVPQRVVQRHGAHPVGLTEPRHRSSGSKESGSPVSHVAVGQVAVNAAADSR
jgi:hypothetical protein